MEISKGLAPDTWAKETSGQRDDLLPQGVGQFLHGGLVEVAGELHVYHPLPEPGLGNDRPLGFGGEGGDAVDGELHLVHLLRQLGSRFEIDVDAAGALAGEGTDFPHALDGLDRFLDAQDHPLLDLLRRGARERHLHLDLVAVERGEGLLLDLRPQRVDAEADDGEHQQVGGDVVLGEPADQTVDFVAAR